MQLNEDKFEYVSGTSYAIKQLLIIYACTIPLTVLSFIVSYFTQFTILATVLVTIAIIANLFRLKKEREVAYHGELAIAKVDFILRKPRDLSTTVMFTADGHGFRFVANSRTVNVKEGDCVRVKHLNYKYYVPEGNCGAGKFRIWKTTV